MKNSGGESISATIRIGQEIQCLLYAVFFSLPQGSSHLAIRQGELNSLQSGCVSDKLGPLIYWWKVLYGQMEL